MAVAGASASPPAAEAGGVGKHGLPRTSLLMNCPIRACEWVIMQLLIPRLLGPISSRWHSGQPWWEGHRRRSTSCHQSPSAEAVNSTEEPGSQSTATPSEGS